MQFPSSQSLSPLALTKSHSHFFPIFFLQPINNFSFSSTGPDRLTRVLLLEILHDHSHPQTQKANQFSHWVLVHFPHILHLQSFLVSSSQPSQLVSGIWESSLFLPGPAFILISQLLTKFILVYLEKHSKQKIFRPHSFGMVIYH